MTISSTAAAIPAHRFRRHNPIAQMSSATPLAYTNPVGEGRKCGTMGVKVAGWARWITPLIVKGAATIHGRYVR